MTNPYQHLRPARLLLLASAMSLGLANVAQAQDADAKASFINAEGTEIGTATLTDTPAGC